MTDPSKKPLWEDEEDYDSDEGEETFGLTPKAADEEAEESKQPSQQEQEPQVSSFERSDKQPRDDRNDRGYENRDRPQRNNRDRDDRGPRNDRQQRQNREPREKREFKYNPESNFRLFYLNDPQFYEVVIRKEEAPYEFKIHLFLDGPKDDQGNKRDIGCMLLEKLNEYGAKNFRDQMIWGNSEKNNDKIRYTFVIEDKDQAIKCYKFFVLYSKNQKNYKLKKQQEEDPDFNLKQQLMIYLQKEEDVFERYGDEEAELYNMMQKMEEQTRAARGDDREKRDRDGGSKKDFRQKNDKFGKTSKREAEDLGIQFQRGGPPRFKNDRKKEEEKKEKDQTPEEKAVEKEEGQTEKQKEEPLGANSNYQIRNDRADRGDRGDRGNRGGRGGRGRGDRGDRRGGRGGPRRSSRSPVGDRDDREGRDGNADRGRVYQRKRGGDGPKGGDRENQDENPVYRQKATEVREDQNGDAQLSEGKEEQKQSSRGGYRQRGDRGGYRQKGDNDRQYQKKNYDQEENRENQGDRKRGGDNQRNRNQYKEKTQNQDGEQQLYKKKKQYDDKERAEYKKKKQQEKDQKKTFGKSDQPPNKMEKTKSNRFAGMEDFE